MSTKNVKLKGTKEGYTILLPDTASFDDILKDLAELLNQTKQQRQEQMVVPVCIDTGNRLLTDTQLTQIYQLVDTHQAMKIAVVQTNVMTKEAAKEWKESENVQTLVTTIRNGQIVTAPGDILLLGSIHQGGTLKAVGNIYILGELKGIAHAGSQGDEDKIVIAKFNHESQVRIGEQVEIIEGKMPKNMSADMQVAYVDDLHVLGFTEIDKLKTLKPKLASQTGGLL